MITVLPAGGDLDFEAGAISFVRDAYIQGRITLEAFEDCVEHILADSQTALSIFVNRTVPRRPDPGPPTTH